MMIHLALALTLSASFVACGDAQPRAALDGATTASAAASDTASDSDEDARVRRIWANARDYTSPSPDGRYFAFVDWSTGDVALHDITTGEDRRLTDKGTWTENGSWAEEPLFGPDGRRVAYSYGNALLEDEADFRYELRLVELGDTTQHVLVALTPDDSWIAPTDWSDSQGILVEINYGAPRDFATELVVVDPATGSRNVLKSYTKDAAHPHDAYFSPDGRFVAYREGKDARLMAADGTGDRSLDMEVRWVLGWTPDGGAVLVHASAQSTTGIWAIPVANGRSAGSPELIRGGIPALIPSGMARGALHYLVPVDAPKIHTVSLDIAAGRVLAPPVAITSAVDGRAQNPAWSPDGRSLAYVLRDTERRTRIMLRAADGDELRELATLPSQNVAQMFWSPDGQALLVNAPTREGPALFRVEIRTGAVSTVMQPVEPAAITPDGRLVYNRDRLERSELPSGLFVRDLATGEERRLADSPGQTRTLGVSPDGRQLAMVVREEQTTRVVVMSLEDGASRVLLRADYPLYYARNMGSLPWTPDGQHLLVMRGRRSDEGGTTRELLAVPVAGGTPVRLMEFPPGRPHPSLHPDGRRLAYTAGEHRDELWVLEGLESAR